jgi:hypothetical protein
MKDGNEYKSTTKRGDINLFKELKEIKETTETVSKNTHTEEKYKNI